MDKVSLRHPSAIPDGFQHLSYPAEQFDLCGIATNFLVSKGFLKEPVPLERLHEHVTTEAREGDPWDELNPVSRAFYEATGEFQEAYFALIKYLGQELVPFDFIFQTTPTVRCLFPQPFSSKCWSDDGRLLTYHSDTMFGHPFEEVNAWLPLTTCRGTSALHCSPLADGIDVLDQFCATFDYSADIYHRNSRPAFVSMLESTPRLREQVERSCVPVETGPGKLVLFDSRCLHATRENRESDTRVSLDFRIIPLERYERMTRVYRSMGRTKRRFARGDIFYHETARAL